MTIGDVDVYGDHLELRDLTLNGSWNVYPGADDVTFRNLTVKGGIFITGGSNISMIGGSVGPGVDYHPQIAPWPVGSPISNILIDGVLFHDWTRSSSTVHTECLQIAGGNGVTIRNSTFRNCAVFDLSITDTTLHGRAHQLPDRKQHLRHRHQRRLLLAPVQHQRQRPQQHPDPQQLLDAGVLDRQRPTQPQQRPPRRQPRTAQPLGLQHTDHLQPQRLAGRNLRPDRHQRPPQLPRPTQPRPPPPRRRRRNQRRRPQQLPKPPTSTAKPAPTAPHPTPAPTKQAEKSGRPSRMSRPPATLSCQKQSYAAALSLVEPAHKRTMGIAVGEALSAAAARPLTPEPCPRLPRP